MRHSVSVAGVMVNDDGRAPLIQRRDNGRWEPPGGVLELDETIVDGLLREVREETGLLVEPVGLTGVHKNMTRGVVTLVFQCRAVEGGLATNDEVRAFRWAAFAEVPSLMDEAYAVRAPDALRANAPACPVRQHDGVNLVP
ncbi:NUDIX hydrolase [Actinomadura kijaniata]|uniref:NUDIX hydrolase n=1 Tax=Actinomadura kijaniata TaxID=46161 RepID=UPI003F1B234F